MEKNQDVNSTIERARRRKEEEEKRIEYERKKAAQEKLKALEERSKKKDDKVGGCLCFVRHWVSLLIVSLLDANGCV